MAVVIETTLGDLSVDLFVKERPQACLNFLKLCKLKYYNFNLFHNIEHGFIAQTGDPTGVGDGGESVWGVIEGPHKKYFEAESLPKIKHTVPGLVSMVSVGNDMVGSQFFFTLGPDLTSLDGVHCVIGEVAEGIDVLRKINESIVDEKYRPYQDIRITHTVILEDPFDDPRGFQIPSRSPSPTAERLKNGRIGADEDIDDTEGKSVREIQEMLQEREAKARATILEIVGDLPDADIAPPENVLFVCKLNPVTTDDDLEIIFSRFGKVKSCEVIRDKVSGDSLQYAFVEFEDKKSCEKAYFKMDNVLIDDRRIHVDFSQSVAKVRWRGKGRGVVRSDGKDGGKLDFSRLRESDRSENHSRSYKAKNGSEKEASTAKGSHSRSRHNFNDSQRRERRRSRSREREQNVRQRSSSRSPQNHERNSPARSRHADKSNRSRHRSRTLSPKYDKNSRYRDENTRRVDTSSRSNYNRERYENVRQDNRKYHKSRSRSRSPRRTGSSHYHDAQEKQKYQGIRSEYGRRDAERKKTTESNSRSSRKEQTNSSRDNRTERISEHSSRSSKHGESKQKELKKRHERSKEESLTSSDESSSQSSSSSDAAHKRKKKPPKKKSSKKKRRKNSSSSTSDSSSD